MKICHENPNLIKMGGEVSDTIHKDLKVFLLPAILNHHKSALLELNSSRFFV